VSSEPVLLLVVAAAFIFSFGNGFRDSGVLIVTPVSTGAFSPGAAAVVAGTLGLAGAFLSVEVAGTVASRLIDPAALGEDLAANIVFAGLVGAVAWTALVSLFNLPSSSSHALIGGLVGASVASAGTGSIELAGLVGFVLIPALVLPVVALGLGLVSIGLAYRLAGQLRPGTAARGFRAGQVLSGGLLWIAHGTNDSQKAMGAITLALIASGELVSGSSPPFWAILLAGLAIASGTFVGGWVAASGRRRSTMNLDSAQGFAAQTGSGAALMAGSFFGFPLSTVQVLNGSVVGAGAGRRLSAARWGLAGNILVAWIVTLPAAALIGALLFGLDRLVGGGTIGAAAVLACSVVGLVAFLAVRRAGLTAEAAVS
jgi:PiT family inorganic phosphate transporter